MAKAYPYIRYSSAGQADGSSADRQRELAATFATRLGLDLQAPIEDLGRSAAEGANLQSGPLADFFAEVHSGLIDPGSVLIVEDPDRVSRGDPFRAIFTISELVKAGLTVAFSKSGDIIKPDSDWHAYLMTLFGLGRANEENKRKRALILEGWATRTTKAKSNKTALTRMCWPWLRVVDNKYEIIPQHAEIIERVFRETVDLGLGAGLIARRLNSGPLAIAPWVQISTGKSRTIREGWDPAYIGKLLKNRALIGEYQTHVNNISTGKRSVAIGRPEPDYYPRVIDQRLWDRAQVARVSRIGTGGPKTTAYNNLLTGLGTCAACGSRIHMRMKQSAQMRRRNPKFLANYLICSAALRGSCTNRQYYAYRPIEDALLATMQTRLFDAESPAESQIGQLEIQLATVSDKILRVTDRGRKLVSADVEMDEFDAALLDQIRSDVKRLSGEKKALETEITEARVRVPVNDQLAMVRALMGALKSEDDTIRFGVRAKVALGLKSIIDQVAFGPDQLITVQYGGIGRVSYEFRDGERYASEVWSVEGEATVTKTNLEKRFIEGPEPIGEQLAASQARLDALSED